LKKILIIQTASLGDVILATPVIEKLHHYFPESAIDFLMKKGYESLFFRHPYLHQIITWDKSHKKYRHLNYLRKMVREREYDAVINLQRFASSGYITAFSGADHRIGFHKNPFSLFFTKRIRHRIGKSGKQQHETERNLRLITHLTDDTSFGVKLYPSNHDYARVSQYKTRQFITIAPGSLWFTKQYPEEKWNEFIDKVINLHPDMYIYLLGSSNEKGLCDRIFQRSAKQENLLNLAGKFTLLESAALMRDARMNYVNDSAPMHLASSVNAPTTAVYCSTVPEFGFGPLSKKSFIIQAQEDIPCKPCGLHGFRKCPKKHFDCAYKIRVEQLVETL
jgi:heptosyltransferase II